MQDLNATIFYKAKFKIAANDSTIDLLWTLVYDIRSWLLGKWNNENHKRINPDVKIWSRFKSGGRLFDEEKTNLVYGESMKCVYGDEGVVSWACRIVEKIDPKQGFCPREWTTEIGYQSTDKSSAEISYIITFNDIPGYIGLREQVPTFGVPRVIRALLSNEKITCSIGNDQLPCDPIWLNSGDYSSFEKMIFNPVREVPIIYISPYVLYPGEENEQATLLVSPYKMAKNVAANAIVYCSNNVDFTKEMNQHIDSQYTCFDGSICVYYPITYGKTKDQYKHRIIHASFILENGEDTVLEIFHRAFAQEIHYYESMFRLKDCKKLIDESKRKARNEEICLEDNGE